MFWRVIGENFSPIESKALTVIDAIAEATERGAKLEDIREVLAVTDYGLSMTAATYPPNHRWPVAYSIGPVGGGQTKHGPFCFFAECFDIQSQEGDAIIVENLEGQQKILATAKDGVWLLEEDNCTHTNTGEPADPRGCTVCQEEN